MGYYTRGMHAPPRIYEAPPKVVDLEVVPPIGGGPRAKAPIHPLSAMALLLIDNLWMLEEWLIIDWIITIPLCFITVFVPVFFVQKLLHKDSTGRALGYAALLGVIAAVPTSVTGTPVGLAFLAWTGIAKLFPKQGPK